MGKFAFQQKRPKEKAKIIRKILKQEFPGTKFRVRSDHSAVNINWKLGPSSKRVEALKLNLMENVIEYRGPSGGVRERQHMDYIFTNREVDPDTMEAHAKKALANRYVSNWYRDNALYSEVHQTMRDTSFDTDSPSRGVKRVRKVNR